MENGELALWDPAKIIAAGSSADSDSLILRNTTHTGPIRGLSFNPIQKSLLASGATAGEVYIWDLKDPSKPYTPTTESAAAAGPGGAAGGAKKLEDITSIEWNRQVPYILAGASSTGYCVVWDLRGKREVVALSFSGGGAGMGGQGPMGPMGGMMMGASTRRGISDIAWHPDNVCYSLFSGLYYLFDEFTSPGYPSSHLFRGRYLSYHPVVGLA
jgi:protein transport protein SEC31